MTDIASQVSLISICFNWVQRCIAQMILLAGPGVVLSTIFLGTLLKVWEPMCLEFIICVTWLKLYVICHNTAYFPVWLELENITFAWGTSWCIWSCCCCSLVERTWCQQKIKHNNWRGIRDEWWVLCLDPLTLVFTNVLPFKWITKFAIKFRL